MARYRVKVLVDLTLDVEATDREAARAIAMACNLAPKTRHPAIHGASTWPVMATVERIEQEAK